MGKDRIEALFAGALAALLLLGANHFSPLLSPLLLFLPLPILAVGLRHGPSHGLIALGILSVAAWIEVPGWIYPVMNASIFGIFPLLAAQMLRMGWRTIHCGAVAFYLGAIGLLLGILLSHVLDVGLESLLTAQMDAIREEIVLSLRESRSLDAARLAEVELGLTHSFRTAALMLLGGMGLGWFLIQTLNLVVIRPLAERWNIPLAKEDLDDWRVPEFLVWPFIACILASLGGNGILRFLGINLGVYLTAPYFLQGVSVARSAFRHYKVGGFLRGSFYALLLFWMEFALLVAAVGLFDTWVDFRQRFFAARKSGLPPGGDNGHGSDSA